MKKVIRLACGAAALVVSVIGSNALASGQHGGAADPSDAKTTVPATRYGSFVAARPVQANTGSPADTWKAVNQAVGSYDTMSLTMDMAAPATAEPAARDAGASPAKKSAESPHAGHNTAPSIRPDPHAGQREKEKK